MNRRAAIGMIAGATPLALGFYTWQVEPHWLELTTRTLPVAGLNPNLIGCTLAQLSDLHIGPKVDDHYLEQSFARIRDLAPDFVAVTGDWITYRGPAQFEQLRRMLDHIPHGKLGTVGILGNHDYGFNWRMEDVADRIARIVTSAGFVLLRNQAVSLSGLQFVGLDDLWSPRFAPENILSKARFAPSTIVLCHNPDAMDQPVWTGYAGWTLSGHTHGGQCKPPFLPPPLLPVKNKRYVSGEISLDEGRKMYISRGIGHLLQVRFNVRPEIPLFTLANA